MELGPILARAAQKGARIKNIGSMCKDCAFRVQPNGNGYEDAVLNAAGCLLNGDTFHCHTPDHQDAGTPCIGFQYAKVYFEKLDNQVSNDPPACINTKSGQ